MIPLSDENPTRITPYVTYGLIAACVIVYLIDAVGARGPFGNLWNWSMIPYSVLNDIRVQPVFNQVGQVVGAQKLPGVGFEPQWITLFTSMFMHGGLLHLGGNMLYLWIFGNNIEDALGHVKFLLFYLGAGLLASGAHILSVMGERGAFVPTVGASGAIAGVLGAYLLLFPGNRVRTLVWLGFFVTFVEIPAVIVLGVWFLGQFTGVLGSSLQGGGVAYWAHIGGFVAGIVLILMAGGKKLTRNLRRHRDDRDRLYPY